MKIHPAGAELLHADDGWKWQNY